MRRRWRILFCILIIVFTVIAVSIVQRHNDLVQINYVLQKEIPKKSAVRSFEIIAVNIKGDFAKATIKPLDVQTDNAWVILQKKRDFWRVIWGPGTDINPDDPVNTLIPRNL